MLIFRSEDYRNKDPRNEHPRDEDQNREDHIQRWRKAWRQPRGAILSIKQAWKLADAWYRDRMSAGWRRRTPDEAHELFHSLGLTSDFWHFS